MASPLIIALDTDSADAALRLVADWQPEWCALKVGKELFTAAGPRAVEALAGRGFRVFLDLKFHDIPETVARACRAARDLGVWMLNVHALGGRAMLAAARTALPANAAGPLLVAVTLLTSLDEKDLSDLGIGESPDTLVRRLARLAHASGLDGVVCSAREAASLRAELGAGFRLVTPGIRPEGATADDQARVMTPRAALRAGADYLVVGRPVTRSADPTRALEALYQQICTKGQA